MFGFVSGSRKESRGIELVLEEGATSPGRHGIRASKQLPDDPDLIVAKLPVGSHQSQLFNKGLSDEQSVEGIPVIVGQRVSSQGVVQMYGQNLKAIGSLKLVFSHD